MQGKVALITGGAKRVGAATGRLLHASGANLMIHYRSSVDEARALQDELNAIRPDSVALIQADLLDVSGLPSLINQTVATFGGLDVLVNNVGDSLMIAKPFDDYSDEDIERLYAVNLKHIFLVTRAMLPLLRRNGPGGSIISLSSIEGFRAIPNCSVYASFKSAISGFTKSLALELGPLGIRVNQIAPESTETPQLPISAMIAAEHQAQVPHWIPLGRFGKAEDMAGAALFLASPLSGWITGTTLHVDGGALAAAGWYRDPRGTWTNVPVISGNGFNF